MAFCGVLCNACRSNGTTPFERVFMSQEPGPKDSIVLVMELLEREPDFTMADVEPNVRQAVDEHPRLREVLSKCGAWEEVDVDVMRQHLFWLPEAPQQATMNMGVPAREESPELRHALENMPAFMDPDGLTPRWQVLLSARRLVMQIHHAAIDGSGLAMIAGTLLSGATVEETVESMVAAGSQTGSARPPASGCFAKLGSCCTACGSFNKHANIPTLASCCPFPASPISDYATVADIADVRHTHIGPFSLRSLKSASKANGATVNSTLLSCVSAACRDYAGANGGDAEMRLGVAIPINFKMPDAANPQGMRANNDFATMILEVPLAKDDADDDLPVIEPTEWSSGVAMGAWAAQASLSFAQPCVVAWMLRAATKRTSFIFSNVNGSAFGDTFVSVGTGARKKVRAYAYGCLSGSVRVFVLVNSHGDDVHVGLTVDEAVVKDRQGLVSLVNERILAACDSLGSSSRDVR